MLVQPAPPERRLMDAFPTNASIMNSVHTKMPPMFNNEESQNKRSANQQQNQQHQHNQHNHQQPSPISFQHQQQESPSDPHQNLIPLQSKTSNSVGNSSGNGGGEAVGIPIIRIPIQHQQSSSGSNGSSTQNQNKESLRSPLVLNTALSIPTTSQSSGASPGGPGNPVGGPGLIPGHPVPHQGLSELRTSASFGGPTSIPTLHAAHVDTMKKRFEEAKERINAMHQRAAAGQPFPFLSPPGAPNIDPFTDELDFFSRIRSRPQRLGFCEKQSLSILSPC